MFPPIFPGVCWCSLQLSVVSVGPWCHGPGFESYVTVGVTRLEFVTEGILLREMLSDPLLTRFSALVVFGDPQQLDGKGKKMVIKWMRTGGNPQFLKDTSICYRRNSLF